MAASQLSEERRVGDPYLDRRSGGDRRAHYDLDIFEQIGAERRSGIERRQRRERRAQWVKVSEWSSISTNVNSPVNKQKFNYLRYWQPRETFDFPKNGR